MKSVRGIRPPLVRRLDLTLDTNGIIRCGGRFHHAEIGNEAKHPIRQRDKFDTINEEFGLASRVRSTVTDNGCNFIKAVRLYGEKESASVVPPSSSARPVRPTRTGSNSKTSNSTFFKLTKNYSWYITTNNSYTAREDRRTNKLRKSNELPFLGKKHYAWCAK